MGASPGDRVILVNPSEVVPIMKKIPKGKLIDIHGICKKIAKKHRVKACCTLTTGIFISTAANAVDEAIREGKKTAITKVPYWRTVKNDGLLNEKYPGGMKAHKKLLEKERFKIEKRGKKYFVKDYEKYLIK